MTKALRTTSFQVSHIDAPGLILSILLAGAVGAHGQGPDQRTALRLGSISKPEMLRIVRAEDERRWDTDLSSLLSDGKPAVRRRAALAAGRIGDERAVQSLVLLLQNDGADDIKAMAAFALGETESAAAGDALVVELGRGSTAVKARVVEALGKITAALPATDEARLRSFRSVVYSVLEEANRQSGSDREVILLGLTAALRARPENVGKVIAEFLTYRDPRVRADAANALARLRAKDGNDQLRKLLTTDPDGIVRANAVRVLGATEDKATFDGLLDRALKDPDSRVRVSAIRALAVLKDARAASPLLNRAQEWTAQSLRTFPGAANEALEIVTTLGRLQQAEENEESLAWLQKVRDGFNSAAPEVEIAFARISPRAYLSTLGAGAVARKKAQEALVLDWKSGSSIGQGLGAIASLPEFTKDKNAFAEQAQDIVRAMLDYKNSGIKVNTLVAEHPEYAIPDVLRAFAEFKPKDLRNVLLSHLKESDVIIRATAAELSGELPADETIASALVAALRTGLEDRELNDAALAILDSLAKQKTSAAAAAIKSGLDSSDHLIRRRAVALLKANGAGDFSARIGTVQTRNTRADYERAIARIGRTVQATVSTTQGSFTIELFPGDAPLNVDNFVQLSKRGYYRGIAVHRVVPNFVIQDGDPRGDGNGGPGYSIRCEINQVPYERGAVGMALSGKDTGGSQWFATHSPQPHLDGGYTVFGKVISGMDVVDRITRGDIVRSIVITENVGGPSRR